MLWSARNMGANEREMLWQIVLPAAMLAGILLGGLCGAINGALISGLRVVPFIVTLGTMSIFFALNIYVSRAATIRGADMDPLMLLSGETFQVLGTKITYGSVAGQPGTAPNTVQFTDKYGDGNYICRGCGPGDGFALLELCLGWKFIDALKAVESAVGTSIERATPAPWS